MAVGKCWGPRSASNWVKRSPGNKRGGGWVLSGGGAERGEQKTSKGALSRGLIGLTGGGSLSHRGNGVLGRVTKVAAMLVTLVGGESVCNAGLKEKGGSGRKSVVGFGGREITWDEKSENMECTGNKGVPMCCQNLGERKQPAGEEEHSARINGKKDCVEMWGGVSLDGEQRANWKVDVGLEAGKENMIWGNTWTGGRGKKRRERFVLCGKLENAGRGRYRKKGWPILNNDKKGKTGS